MLKRDQCRKGSVNSLTKHICDPVGTLSYILWCARLKLALEGRGCAKKKKEETGDKRESARRDCWWVITAASVREHPPVGTEALVAWEILWLVSRRVWGARSPKHAAALCVSTTGGVTQRTGKL
jgi:hypothetical protein